MCCVLGFFDFFESGAFLVTRLPLLKTEMSKLAADREHLLSVVVGVWLMVLGDGLHAE